MALKLSVSLLALAGSAFGGDLPSIVRKGSKLFYSNGTEFFIKGVAYQQDTAAAGATNTLTDSFSDPLADAAACKRDVPLLAELGTNTIRTYAINPNADHSACMELLQDHGIYVISDLGNPSISINRADPQWNTELFAHYQQVVDGLSKYSNVLGFFAGNEVSNNQSNTGASAYVKAAVRDTKAYIKQKGYRWMGVGYAANDDVDIRRQIADYFNCGEEEDSIDFWGYNIYSWCGDSDFQASGYNDDLDFFKDYSAPVFFAEYGCNLPNGAASRTFQETAALFSDNMTEVFSGGIVFMYFEETNDYGLVQIHGNTANKMKDFAALQKQVTSATPEGVEQGSYNPTNQAAKCPAIDSSWQANSNLPPTPDEDLCNCMSKSRKCVRKTGLAVSKYEDLFNYICADDKAACAAINGNTKAGVYGAYSMCTDGQKLDYVLDAYYNSQDKGDSACDFNGKAMVQAGSTGSGCGKALSSANAHNSQAATATSAGEGAGSTGANDDDEGLGVPGVALTPVLSVGGIAISLYLLVTMMAGAAIVAL